MDTRHWGAETYERQQAAAWGRFGRMIRRWRSANGWTQYLGERIQRELNIPSLSPSNWSTIETGKAGQMKPSTFWKLAELNSRVHHGEWPPIHSRELKDWLANSRPILNEEGEPWGPSEFWACATGETEPPDWLDDAAAPEIDDARAGQLSREWEAAFQRLRSQLQIEVIPALTGVTALVPTSERGMLQEVLMGQRQFTAEQLRSTYDRGWLPALALERWRMQELHKRQQGQSGGENPEGA